MLQEWSQLETAEDTQSQAPEHPTTAAAADQLGFDQEVEQLQAAHSEQLLTAQQEVCQFVEAMCVEDYGHAGE